MRGASRSRCQERAQVVRLTKATRARLVALVSRQVDALVRRNDRERLDALMDLTGFLSNTAHTTKEIGAAITALAPAIEDSWLAQLAHSAHTGGAFVGRALRREGVTEREMCSLGICTGACEFCGSTESEAA